MKAVSLFSGVGGFDFGFKRHDFDFVFANDSSSDACTTYRHNEKRFFSTEAKYLVQGDIDKVSSPIPKADLLLAGFPCTPFSVAGPREGFKSKEGSLFFSLLTRAKQVNPKIMILENVADLKNHDEGKTFGLMVCKLIEHGFKVHFEVLDFSEYGVPQTRKRLLIFCVQKKLNLDPRLLVPTAPKTVPKTLNELIGGLPKQKVEPETIEKLRWIKILRPGESLGRLTVKEIFERQKRLPAIFQPPRKPIVSFLPNRRLEGDRVAKTVVAGASYFHPIEDRRMSIIENALIQGFPADFCFLGSRGSQQKQVGNAVSPIISEHLAKQLIEHLRS